MMSGYPKSKTKENLERTWTEGTRERMIQIDTVVHCTIGYKEVKSKATSYLDALTI